jgi:hypothetical protein
MEIVEALEKPPLSASGPTTSINDQRNGDDDAPIGLTLVEYANYVKLPIPFLCRLGLSDVKFVVFGGVPSVRIPYPRQEGTEATRYRLALGGDRRFVWKRGGKPLLYNPADAFTRGREVGFIAIVEGESDVHELTYLGVPAVGLPGVGNFNEARDAALFEGIGTIFVIDERDGGRAALFKWLAVSSICSRVRLVSLGEYKDPRELWVANQNRTHFEARWTSWSIGDFRAARTTVEGKNWSQEAGGRLQQTVNGIAGPTIGG